MEAAEHAVSFSLRWTLEQIAVYSLQPAILLQEGSEERRDKTTTARRTVDVK